MVSTILATNAACYAAFCLVYFRRTPTAPPPEAARFVIPLPRRLALSGPPSFPLTGAGWSSALMLMMARKFSGSDRWAHLTRGHLTEPKGGTQPFWSPDSRSIGFSASGKLKRMNVSGGPPHTLCDAPGNNLGGTWSRAGVIVFGQSSQPWSLPCLCRNAGDPSASPRLTRRGTKPNTRGPTSCRTAVISCTSGGVRNRSTARFTLARLIRRRRSDFC